MAGGLTNAGCSAIAVYVTGNVAAIATFNSTAAYLGVGSASTAFAATQTDLQESTNKSRKPMQTGYPTVSNQTITHRALWTAASANHGWNEIALFNATSGGTMLYRDVQDLGDKPASQSWQLTVTAQIIVD
jgi:hypothetical protein